MSSYPFILNLSTLILVLAIFVLWAYGFDDAAEDYGLLVVAFLVGRIAEMAVV